MRALARAWGAVNPAALLVGPIFQKEVRSAGRRKGTYWARAVYLAILLGIVSMVFIGIRMDDWGGAARRIQQLQTVAPAVAISIAWVQYMLLSLAGPALTGGAISEERRRRTLPALMTTPLTSAQIVLGKLSGSTVQLVILTLIAAPLLLALRVFGGLDAEPVLAAAGIALSTAVLGAALALLYSTWHSGGTVPVMFAIFSLALLQGGPIVGWAIVAIWTESDIPPDWLLTTCSPYVLTTVSTQIYAGGDPGALRGTWLMNIGYNLGLALLLCLAATASLRRLIQAQAAGSVPFVPRVRRRRRARAAKAGEDADPPPAAEPARPDEHFRDRGRSRTVGDRPVFWRELRRTRKSTVKELVVFLACGLGAMLLSLALTSRGEYEPEGVHMTFCIIAVLGVMLCAAMLTTQGITSEREASTWEVLMTTRLGAWEVLWGKFAGGVRKQAAIPAALLLFILLSALLGRIRPMMLVHAGLIMLGPMVFLAGTGLLFSLMFRKSAVASILNLSLALALWLGTWVAIALLEVASGYQSEIADALGELNFMLSPVAMTVSAAEGNTPYGLHRGGQVFDIGYDSASPARFTGIVFAVWLGYTISGLACVALAAALFRRFGGRAS